MTIRSQHGADDATLFLPRILCLHGGGTNAPIFRAQCRTLVRQLQSRFRLCFADGPYLSPPAQGIIPVYQDYGPFRSWLGPETDDKTTANEVVVSLTAAMEADDKKGATGEWVGMLGFSQGAKMSASLLLRQPEPEPERERRAGTNFRFAVLLAGSPPLLSAFNTQPTNESFIEQQEPLLRLPTIHVHGLKDQGLLRHRQLLDDYCEKGSTRLIEWEGEHRVPIKSTDVKAIVNHIIDVSRQAGVLW